MEHAAENRRQAHGCVRETMDEEDAKEAEGDVITSLARDVPHASSGLRSVPKGEYRQALEGPFELSGRVSVAVYQPARPQLKVFDSIYQQSSKKPP
jgi:hypothetical protein